MLKIKPLRSPRANQISTTIFHYSKKLGRQVWCESNLEWDVAILLDHDPFVKHYCEQGIELQWSGSKWTPDFVALIKEDENYTILIIEVKYLRDLLENKDSFLKKFSESRKWLEERKNVIISKLTRLPVNKIEFILVTDQIINQSFRVQNLRKLMQASIDPTTYIEIKKRVKSILFNKPNISFQELIETINTSSLPENNTIDDIWSTIFAMIYHFEIYVNFEELITKKSILYELNTFGSDFKPLNNWIRTYDWKNQEKINSAVIEYTDLYGLTKDPNKSIKLWEEANSRFNIIQPLLETPVKELREMTFVKDGEGIFWFTAFAKRIR